MLGNIVKREEMLHRTMQCDARACTVGAGPAQEVANAGVLMDVTTPGTPLVFEQIIRPTGLLDPKIFVRPLKGQIDETIELCRGRVGLAIFAAPYGEQGRSCGHPGLGHFPGIIVEPSLRCQQPAPDASRQR